MNNWENILRQAQIFEENGKFLHAIQLYSVLKDKKECSRIANVKLANAYEKLKKPHLAKKILDSYLEQNPDDEEIKKIYSHFLIRNAFYDLAIDKLSEISREEHPEVYFLMGVANYNLKEYEIAELNFKEFIAKSKDADLVPEAYLFLAKTQLHRKKYDEALESGNKSSELFYQNHELHKTLATIYFHKKMFYHAYEAIRTAIKINAKEISTHYCAGKILFELGEYGKAEKHLRKYLEEFKNDRKALELLGTCLRKQGKNELFVKPLGKNIPEFGEIERNQNN